LHRVAFQVGACGARATPGTRHAADEREAALSEESARNAARAHLHLLSFSWSSRMRYLLLLGPSIMKACAALHLGAQLLDKEDGALAAQLGVDSGSVFRSPPIPHLALARLYRVVSC